MNKFACILISFLLAAGVMSAQRRGFDPDKLYRPVYGYVVDTCAGTPVADVLVYGFDNISDALSGRKALEESRNPLKMKLKGEVVETRTDLSGRYMLPALREGVILFWFKDSREGVIEEINGRNSVNLGKKEKEWSIDDLDLDKYARKETDHRKGRHLDPVAVDLNMDFSCYLPYLGDEAADSRVWVERRIMDMTTGEVLASHVPVVRDGRNYHRQMKRSVRRDFSDALLDRAEKFEPLSEKTSEIRVRDSFSTEPWKNEGFRLGYFVMKDLAGDVSCIDTLYMMTNRVNKPLKYLEYAFKPFHMAVPDSTSAPSYRHVRRRIVVDVGYDGTLPEVLRDSAYVLKELHLKAEVTSCSEYGDNIARADSLVDSAMAGLKDFFGGRLNGEVRLTKTSSSPSVKGSDKVTCRMVFSTVKRFSEKTYLELFAAAKERYELDSLCVRAMEESEILSGRSWAYAANLLAIGMIDSKCPDPHLLAPFIDKEFAAGNISEIVANQVIMLMLSGDRLLAADLAELLPAAYAPLRALARCSAGIEPASDQEMEALASSSLRNRVVADMFTGILDGRTSEALRELPEDEAMTWFLRARYLCLMYDNDTSLMKSCHIQDNEGMSVYEAVQFCLDECFRSDPGYKSLAMQDSGIEENVLKQILGVYVL